MKEVSKQEAMLMLVVVTVESVPMLLNNTVLKNEATIIP
jgi:hypothetical protein